MRRLILVFIILQLLNGCGPSTTIDSYDQTDIDPEQQARAFLLADDFAAAAEEYLRLGGKNKSKSIEYKLKAAEAYIDGDNLEHASHILENLNQDNVSPSQLAFKNILYAQIALLENNPDTALELLNIDLPDNTSRSLNAAYHETRALVLEQNKKFIDVINERVLLNDFLDVQEDKNNNADFLWKIILKMDLEEINNIRLSSNEQIASWMELAIINKTMIQNKRNMETAVDAWGRHYPEHPALYRIVPGSWLDS
jgi:outer membrane PBP1 activator LpoA protein